MIFLKLLLISVIEFSKLNIGLKIKFHWKMLFGEETCIRFSLLETVRHYSLHLKEFSPMCFNATDSFIHQCKNDNNEMK